MGMNKEQLQAYNQEKNYEFLKKNAVTSQLYGFIRQEPTIPSDRFYDDRGQDFSTIK